MKSQFFCAHHVAQMQANEGEALKHWTQMMHRGVKAYAECRMDAAQIYLESALEIGLLRCSEKENRVFSGTHIFKPAEFVLKTYCMMDVFDLAQRVLQRIVAATNNNDAFFGERSDYFLSAQYAFIEEAEKSFFGRSGTNQNQIHLAASSSVKH